MSVCFTFVPRFMNRLNIIILLVFGLSKAIYAQTTVASEVKLDSAYSYQNKKLDSVQRTFHHRTDSLQNAYASPLQGFRAAINRLNHKKDSLARLHQATNGVSRQIDSIERAQAAKLKELNSQIEKAKKETLASINSLNLPPQAQSEINTLTKSINGFGLPRNFFLSSASGIPGLNSSIPGMSNSSMLSIPNNMGISATSIPSLQKLNMNMASLPSLSKMQGSLANPMKELQSASNLQSLEKTVTSDLAQNSEAKALLKQEAQATSMEKSVANMKDPKKVADSLAKTKLVPQINHFAGKEKELQSAMGQISKYKQKYSSVSSLSNLPKRPPNLLKHKPWIERVVPGVNYFILSNNYALVDFNPYVGWRFNPKLTASIGWNERIGFSQGSVHTNEYDRVYGARGAVSYVWAHGFVLRLCPEVMQAYIPAPGSADVKHQASLWNVYWGIRKDFKIYRNVTGYSEAVYTFKQKPGQNIYGDQLSFRLGIEVSLKKKKAKNNLAMVNPSSLKGRAQKPNDSVQIVTRKKLLGVVTITGDTLIPAKYRRIKKFLLGGKLYFIVRKEKRFGALSASGKQIVPATHPVVFSVKLEIINQVRRQNDPKRATK